ncbi:orotidine-5'-phosphate decarboxylase [Candidatus Spongiihabitans sp.]|uniref:orotidine-5'-phosphate decarboxylase n=1 Tax=Candidatus Spongiihabitans sp. TaxID=3101308 RepID=UPI003C7D8A5B
MSGFYEKLTDSWKQQNSLLCVGLDPDLDRLPKSIKNAKHPLYRFNREIIDATAQWACAYKPQAAYYSAVGAELQLKKTIRYIKSEYPAMPVILDAKRGDIGSSARMYAIEAFERYQADAVTVNPYLGGDALEPFLRFQNHGVIVLCRTSNPGSGDFQQLVSGERAVYQHVAHLAASQWNKNNNVALVVGATYPQAIKEVRQIVGDMPLLVPGVGAQGGDLEGALKNGLTEQKKGLIINVSREVIFASAGADFSTAAANQAQSICRQINQYRST